MITHSGYTLREAETAHAGRRSGARQGNFETEGDSYAPRGKIMMHFGREETYDVFSFFNDVPKTFQRAEEFEVGSHGAQQWQRQQHGSVGASQESKSLTHFRRVQDHGNQKAQACM